MKYFIIGYPLINPNSPIIWNNFFFKKGLSDKMEELEIYPKKFASFKNAILKKNFKAIVVTMPFKKKIMKICNEFHLSSKLTNSCNLIIKNEKKIIGYNTDIIGFEKSLIKKKYSISTFEHCIIYGFGGVGSAIAKYISKKFKKKIYIISSKKYKDQKYIKFNNIKFENLNNALVINCTPIGSILSKKNESPFSSKFINQLHNSLIYDVNYKISKKNELKKFCLNSSNQYMNGLSMNKIQAKEAINFALINEK